jgi:nucleoside-diphosphate-sugar epimerase
MTSSSSVVLLGHTGFLGSALQRVLEQQGVSVRGFSSSTLDLRVPQALSKLDDVLTGDGILVFSSALTPDRGANLDSLADNLAMAINVARYVQTHPVHGCVYVSSDAVYPMVDDDVTESTVVDPANSYALAKYGGERILQIAADTASIPLLIVRPTGVFGAGDPHNSYGPNRFVRSIAESRSVRIFGKGEETRDHIYLEDAVRAIAQLMRAEQSGVFNIATGLSRTFGSIVELLKRIVPFDFEVVEAPRSGAITHRRFDISKLHAAAPGLQFTPFEDALAVQVERVLAVPR